MGTNHIIANLSPSTKMSMDKVKRFLNAGKASVMVGCGFSLNAEDDGTGQMRDWNSLNVDLFKSLYSRAPLAEEMAGLSPIRLASQVKAVHGEHELNEIIMNALPDKSVFPGSLHKKLMKLPWRDVFTTNYDTLLERSCDESGCAYTLVSTKDTLIYSKSPRIIKLHGSFPDKRPFIITEEQFRTYPAKYPEFVNTVRQSLIENLFCLIGFSGNDPNFLSWLGWVRDVMGRQMTNAILIDYKPDGIHISERQLFSDRKIDILNLADIEGLHNYKEALDFFLTYLQMKEEKVSWKCPVIRFTPLLNEKQPHSYSEDVREMTEAHKTYPGWLFLPEYQVLSCRINSFPMMGGYYQRMPNELKLRFLYELDWLLDICLYPKHAAWYIGALEYIKERLQSFEGADKEMAHQLVISLMKIYRESHSTEDYQAVSELIGNTILNELTTKQLSVYYYERCLWSLSVLDDRSAEATLLRWQVSDNDYLSALWQVSVYAALGNLRVAENMLLLYYSRLTTRMLIDHGSDYLHSCAQLYSYVMPHIIRRGREDVDLPIDYSITNLKRLLVEKALKERPKQSQSHGFNIGEKTDSRHMYQGGYVADYCYAHRYLQLTYLHGSTNHTGGCGTSAEFGKMVEIIGRYNIYQAIDWTLRCGQAGLIDTVISRKNLSRARREDICKVFTSLFDMLRDHSEPSNKRKESIQLNILFPILQRLCCKADSHHIQKLFEAVREHFTDCRISRNQILQTIYNCATPLQREEMFKVIMNHDIARDMRNDDILWPTCIAEVDVADNILSHLITALKDSELRELAYYRLLTLLKCKLPPSQRADIETAIIEWRKDEHDDVNAFYSYQIVKASDEADKNAYEAWARRTIDTYLRQDYSYHGSSESITNFIRFADDVIPSLSVISDQEASRILRKAIETIKDYLPHIRKADSDEVFGGVHHFFARMFDELVRMFECINFERIDSKQREELTSLLSECVQAKSPCLYALTIIGAASLSQSVLQSAMSRLLSSVRSERYDAMRTLYYLIAHKEDKLPSASGLWDCINHLYYFIQYSHSRHIDEYLQFLSELYAHRLLDTAHATDVCDALLAIHNEIDTYDMGVEYQIDIAHRSCMLAAVLHELGIAHPGIEAWAHEFNNPEQFRDVRQGWMEGREMVVRLKD